MSADQFATNIIDLARKQGYRVELNRNGIDQIDFGHKKLHKMHLVRLYPGVLKDGIHIGKEVDKVAPGRPCTHKPMKELIAMYKFEMVPATES